MPLPTLLLDALDNLGRKKAGLDVAWINISAARALTELGLAERTREGWVITPAGASALATQAGGSVTVLHDGRH
jgi:hypothetical protein